MAEPESISGNSGNNQPQQPQQQQPPKNLEADGRPIDPAIDAKERLQRFDLVIQHLHRLRATLALDSSVREFQKIHTLTLLGQLGPTAAAANVNNSGVPRLPPLNQNGGLLPPLPPPPHHILGMRPPTVHQQGLMPPRLPIMPTKPPMGR